MGGDGGTQPTAPSAPSVGETSAQAIQAQIDALPQILSAQSQYGPQFSQLNLDQLNQFGPQFAQSAFDLASRFAPQYRDLQNQLTPEVGAAQTTLANYLSGNDTQEFNDLMPGVLEQVRSAQSQRGLGAISPLGAIDESVQLQQLKQSLKSRRLNVALSTAGRVPIGQIPTQFQGTTGTGQLVSNVNPSSIFDYQQGLNSFNANIFGTQSQAATAQRQQNMSLLGSIIGGGLSAGGAVGAASLMPKPTTYAFL